MAVDAGTIFSEVRVQLDTLQGDVRKVNANLDKITKASEDVSKKSQGSFGKFFSFISKTGVGAFLGLSAAIAGVTKFLAESIKTATRSQEVYSKFDTVFETIGAQADTVAETFAKTFDLADSTAQELLGTTGDLITGFGATESVALDLSERVNVLAADLASFSNIEGGVEQASKALTAALLGEREQAKQLGIVIRETDVQQRLLEKGQKDLTGQSLLLAKAEATLELAYQQSQKAIGDYARTQDSAANAQRRAEESSKRLKEAVGTALLPTITAIRNRVGEWASAIAKVIENSNDLRDAEKAIKEGTATIDQRVIALQAERDSLEDSLTVLRRRNEEEKINGRTIAEIIEQQEARIAAIGAENRALSLQAQAEGILNEERRIAAEEEAARAAQEAEIAARRVADIEFRQKVQADLNAELFAITQQEARAAETGEEFNAALEKQQAAQSALNKLFDEGFRLAGPGVQDFLRLYGDLLIVTEETTEATNALADAQAKQLDASQEALFNQLEAFGAFNQDNLDILLEQGRITLEQYVELADQIAIKNAELTEQLINDARFYTTTVGGLFSSLFSSFNSLSDSSGQRELQRIQAQIDASEEGTARRIELEEEYDQKAKELQIEQAKREKALRTFDTIINTAAAIIGFLAPPYTSVPLSIAAGIAGAAQLAAIQAEPLPAFQTGGIVLPSSGGTAVNVAENGSPELLLNGGASGQPLLNEFAQAIATAMGGGQPQTIVVQSILDGKVVAESSAKFYNNGKVRLSI